MTIISISFSLATVYPTSQASNLPIPSGFLSNSTVLTPPLFSGVDLVLDTPESEWRGAPSVVGVFGFPHPLLLSDAHAPHDDRYAPAF